MTRDTGGLHDMAQPCPRPRILGVIPGVAEGDCAQGQSGNGGSE